MAGELAGLRHERGRESSGHNWPEEEHTVGHHGERTPPFVARDLERLLAAEPDSESADQDGPWNFLRCPMSDRLRVFGRFLLSSPQDRRHDLAEERICCPASLV